MGNIDMRKNKNFLVVTESEALALQMAVLLAPRPGSCNTESISAETPVRQIEDTLKDYTNREDIAIVLINQHVSFLVAAAAAAAAAAATEVLCTDCQGMYVAGCKYGAASLEGLR